MRTKIEQVMKLQPTGETYAVDLYEFHELPAEAKDRIVSEFREELERDWQGFADTTESEVWDAVRHLEKSITGARVSWRYNPWYSADFDTVYDYSDGYDPGEIEAVDDNGVCYSMDLCDAWAVHARKLNIIWHRFDGLMGYMADMAPYSWDIDNLSERDTRVYNHYDDVLQSLYDEWYQTLEAACKDIAGTITGMLQAEWDYWTSEEYARETYEDMEAGYECRTKDAYGRVYYHDSRKWFTVDGELYEQASVNHACVSIVKRPN